MRAGIHEPLLGVVTVAGWKMQGPEGTSVALAQRFLPRETLP